MGKRKAQETQLDMETQISKKSPENIKLESIIYKQKP